MLLAVAAGLPLGPAVVLSAAAACCLSWGVAALRLRRVPIPRTSAVAGVAGVLATMALARVGAMGILPLVALSVMLLIIVGWAAGGRRRGRHRGAGGRRSGAVSLACAALVVAAVTTPALAGSEPGSSAVPHGEFHVEHTH